MKRIFWIIGAIVVILLVAAGGFYAGMTYQTNKVSQAQANFERARGSFGEGQLPPGDAMFNEVGDPPADFTSGMRGGVTGQVKSLDGNVLTLSTAENVTTVNLSENTRVLKNATVSLGDLLPGTRVMVTGATDSDGEINAIQIMILDNIDPSGDESNPPGESPAEREP